MATALSPSMKIFLEYVQKCFNLIFSMLTSFSLPSQTLYHLPCINTSQIKQTITREIVNHTHLRWIFVDNNDDVYYPAVSCWSWSGFSKLASLVVELKIKHMKHWLVNLFPLLSVIMAILPLWTNVNMMNNVAHYT